MDRYDMTERDQATTHINVRMRPSGISGKIILANVPPDSVSGTDLMFIAGESAVVAAADGAKRTELRES